MTLSPQPTHPEINRQLYDSLQQLSPERLKAVADFAAFLASPESEAATQ